MTPIAAARASRGLRPSELELDRQSHCHTVALDEAVGDQAGDDAGAGGYLVPEAPASVAVPRMKADLEQANTKIAELEALLAEQATAIEELDSLRKSNQQLESDNITLSNSSWARAIGTGGLIAFLGILIGAAWPRGGKSRRLKL